MASKRGPLNDAQIAVLRWIESGRPDGVYAGYTHRISAKSLHWRGLVRVSGHGPTWSAELTEDGRSYLRDGALPTSAETEASAPRVKESTDRPRASAATIKRAEVADSAPEMRKVPAARRVGVIDSFMASLEANDNRIAIALDEIQRYNQLIGLAKCRGRVPAGQQLAVGHDYRQKTAWVALVPLPARQTVTLDPIRPLARGAERSEAVQLVADREDFDLPARLRSRGLKLLDAIQAEGARRGWRISGERGGTRDSYGFVRRPADDGHLSVRLGPDEYWVAISRIHERVPHVPTKLELANQARFGTRPPKHEMVGTERLAITLGPGGISFWGSEWSDGEDRPLEAQLPQVLQELELRHGHQDERRAEEQRKLDREKREWKQAKARGIAALLEENRKSALLGQVTEWETAARVRAFVAAMRASDLSEEAAAWMTWASELAEQMAPDASALSMAARSGDHARGAGALHGALEYLRAIPGSAPVMA